VIDQDGSGPEVGAVEMGGLVGRGAGFAQMQDFGVRKVRAQPVIRAAPGQTTELCRHRARDRLPVVDDVVDGLSRHVSRFCDRRLIQAKALEFGAQMAPGVTPMRS